MSDIVYSERRKPKQLVCCKEKSKSRRSRTEAEVAIMQERRAERIDRTRRDRNKARTRNRIWRKPA